MKKSVVLAAMLAILLIAQSCVLSSKRAAPDSTEIPTFLPATLMPTRTLTPIPPPTQPVPPNTPDCTNILSYISDLTYPDGSQVAAGSLVSKEWLVDNSGTCNWGEGYSFQLIAGDELGLTTEQPLVNSKAGNQAVVKLDFTAPRDPGNYRSEWQAFSPDGYPFGDSLYLEIVVQ